MTAELRGPGDRYRVTFEALCCVRGTVYTHHKAAAVFAAQEDGRCRVVVPGVCTLFVVAGENGLTVKSLSIGKTGRILINARVEAGAEAPEWLPPESTCLIFEGTRSDQDECSDRYIPFAGMMEDAEEPGGESASPLDRLAVAIGRSVARANAVLARSRASTGTALVSSLTFRVALGEVTVDQGRVLVSLARPDGGDTGQFVELTMTPAPPAEGGGEAESPASAPGPAAGSFDLPRSGT